MTKELTLSLIGNFLENEQAVRDAVHIAVVPVNISQGCYAGSSVKIMNNTAYPCSENERIGIVDPFLSEAYIGENKKAFVFLNPGSISSLVHLWTHPDLDDEAAPAAKKEETEAQWAKRRISECAEVFGLSSSRLIKFMTEWVEYKEYAYMGNNESYSSLTKEDFSDMWKAFRIITGNEKEPEHQHFFTCSC